MSIKILIVDNATFIRAMIKNIVSNNGYAVAGEAENGLEAVKLYQTLRPDLVTMDISIPVMNGIESTKAIKKIDSNARIIICTAVGQQSVVVEAVRAGAMDFIIKPFKQETLLRVMQRALSK